MIVAGLMATGTTEIEDIQYIDRGYEDYIEKFKALGADIYRREFSDSDKANAAG